MTTASQEEIDHFFSFQNTIMKKMSMDQVALLIEEEVSKICRICLDNCHQEDFISPCLCTGGSEYVHRTCLDNWRALNKDGRAFNFCEVCQFQFVIETIIDDPVAERKRKQLFYYFVIRDITLIILLVQVVIIGLAFLLGKIDTRHQVIRQLYPTSMNIVIIYYLSSLTLTLAFLGLYGLISFCCGSIGNHSQTCNTCCCIDIDCSGGQCCECNSSDDACAAPVLILIVVIFAIIGIFVGIFLSWEIFQKILKRHTRKLWLQQETKKYVIKDFQGNRDQLLNASHEYLNVMPSAPMEFIY